MTRRIEGDEMHGSLSSKEEIIPTSEEECPEDGPGSAEEKGTTGLKSEKVGSG
jgi:hypothetical protein